MRRYGRDYRIHGRDFGRRGYGRDYVPTSRERGYDSHFGYFRNRGGWNRNHVPHGYDVDYGYTRGGFEGSRDMSGGVWNVSGERGGGLAAGGSALGGGSGSAGAWGAGGGPYEAYGNSEMGITFGRRRVQGRGYVGGRGLYDEAGGGLGRARRRYGGPGA